MPTRESIFFSSIRSFFVGLFGMAGIVLGLLLAVALLSLIGGAGDNEPESTYTPEIVANASGVRKHLSKDAPIILKLNISGVIGGETLDMKTIRQQLIESREGTMDDRVKALLLYIQTPGGTVIDADGIYKAIKSYKEAHKVPVYAYVDGLCASGGMYVACAADKVFASDVSIIGSVGVVTPPFMNFYDLMTKVGINSLTLTAGKNKDEMNPFRPWKENEQANIQELINYYYNDFVDIVTTNRPRLNREKLVNEYGAQVFPAKTAQEYGYIDESGVSYNDTLKQLAHEIGIEDDYYQVIQFSQPWYAGLFKSQFQLLTGKVSHQIELSPETNPRLNGQFLYLYRPGS